MANWLKMAARQSILTLARLGWSYRRIAAELGLDRDTVSRHVRAADAVDPASAHGRQPPDPNAATAAIDLAASYDRKLVIEQGIPAREIEVSVIGNDAIEASVPGEVVPSNEWYDYAAKYLDGESEIIIPAPIPAETAEAVRQLAITAFRSIDGSGLSRVDFLLDRETGELWINELNTLPGFTPISMYAKMWEASGVSYSELCRRLVHLALERHADSRRNRTDR